MKFREKIGEIALDICKTRIDVAIISEKTVSSAEEKYGKGKQLLENGKYEQGFNSLQKAYMESDMILKGQEIPVSEETETGEIQLNVLLYLIIAILVIIVLFVVLKSKRD